MRNIHRHIDEGILEITGGALFQQAQQGIMRTALLGSPGLVDLVEEKDRIGHIVIHKRSGN
jgi:hypothetical protein